MKTIAINDTAATSEQAREQRKPARELTEDELACVSGGSSPSMISNILNLKHQTAQSIIANIRC